MDELMQKIMTDEMALADVFYEHVNPKDLESLKAALKNRDALQNAVMMSEGEQQKDVQLKLEKQIIAINQYIEKLGELNNRKMVSNITYLARRNDIKIGDLENLLGISAGYISRTANENSKKRMSIDLAWKIARFFEVNILALTESNMDRERTKDIVQDFIRQLGIDTYEGKLNWIPQGGGPFMVEEMFKTMGLVTVEGKNEYYHADHLNPDQRWIISGDIVTSKNFRGNKDLTIIPYKPAEADPTDEWCGGYDFYLIWREKDQWQKQKLFYTAEDKFDGLLISASGLYETISRDLYELSVDKDVRSLMMDYLRRGDDE